MSRPTTTSQWEVSETAIIICDMWIEHPCRMAAQRVAAMAPLLNQVISAARDHGALIVHAPSEGPKFYEGTAFRRRATSAPRIEAPYPFKSGATNASRRESRISPSSPTVAWKNHPARAVATIRKRSHGARLIDTSIPRSKMTGFDAVSDNGQEIFNLFIQEGIKNVVLTGVHTNMCVLGRSFGIRQWVHLGFNVALCRDMTDALYDPRRSRLL